MVVSIAGTLKLQALQQKVINPSDLDTTLLAAAQAGVYLHCLFGVVGDILTMGPTWVLSLITDLLALMQSTSQTLLIKVNISIILRQTGCYNCKKKFSDRVGKALLKKRQARQGADHIPNSRQYRSVDCEHVRKISSKRSPRSPTVLRCVGMDDHHSRIHAAGHILQISLCYMPIRDMEDVLQMPIQQRRPNTLLTRAKYELLMQFQLSCFLNKKKRRRRKIDFRKRILYLPSMLPLIATKLSETKRVERVESK